MKKVFKYGAMLIGAAVLVVGQSACNKDDSSVKCCTGVIDGESDEICENDEEFEELDITWSEFVSYAEEMEDQGLIDNLKCD